MVVCRGPGLKKHNPATTALDLPGQGIAMTSGVVSSLMPGDGGATVPFQPVLVPITMLWLGAG